MAKTFIVIVWFIMLFGCTSGVETATPTPSATFTPAPTATPLPATRTAIAQTHEATERDIYAVLLEHSHFRDRVVALLQEPAVFPENMFTFSTSNPILSPNEQFNRLTQWLPTLQQETWNDFYRLRSAPGILTDTLPTEATHIIIDPDDVPDSPLIEAWEGFWEKYPGSFGMYSVSRIGLNPEQNQALVYVETHCWGKCGEATVFLLEKRDGQWQVIAFDILIIV
jgi:hypothetical protein